MIGMFHPRTQLPELGCVGGALCGCVELRSTREIKGNSQMHSLDPGCKHFTCVGLPLHQLTLGPTHPHWGVAMISHLIASGRKGVETAFNLVLVEGELYVKPVLCSVGTCARSPKIFEPGTVDDVTAVYVSQLANERVYIIVGEHAFLL